MNKKLFHKGSLCQSSLFSLFLISLLFSRSSIAQTPTNITLPCSTLTTDNARINCSTFLNDSQAAGNNPSFSHAFVVSSVSELTETLALDESDGTIISSRVILIDPGTYLLSEPIQISGKVALIANIASGSSQMPVIRSNTDFQPQQNFIASLVDLFEDTSITTGFYSYRLHWDTTVSNSSATTTGATAPPTDTLPPVQYTHENAITSLSYPGEIRIYNNRFSHAGSRELLDDYIEIIGPLDNVFIGYNSFETTNLEMAAIYIEQVELDAVEMVEIHHNQFSGGSTSSATHARYRRQTAENNPVAIDLHFVEKFNIHDNLQLTAEASATIQFQLYNDSLNVDIRIVNNRANPESIDTLRSIKTTIDYPITDDAEFNGCKTI